MNDLISQLFEIATNDEFSESQRKGLMRIALDEAEQQPAHAVVAAAVEVGPTPAHIDEVRSINNQIVDDFFNSEGGKQAIQSLTDAYVSRRKASLSLNIDETLGRHLTKERTPNGIRFGLDAGIPSD